MSIVAELRRASGRVTETEVGSGGATIWLTGLPSSGKSTIARLLVGELEASGRRAELLDADLVRQGLNADLGFGALDRHENARRLGEVALLFASAGHIAVVAAISPYATSRERVRRRHEAEGVPFYEVHVATPLDLCEARDPKGLYAAARARSLEELTGVDAPYEAPAVPDLRLATDSASARSCARQVVALLDERLGAPSTSHAPRGAAGPLPSGAGGLRNVARLWPLGFALATIAAAVDLALGPHIRLLGLLSIGPASIVLTGRRSLAALAGLWAIALALALDGPDHLWGTRAQAVNLVALSAVTLVAVGVATLVGRSLDSGHEGTPDTA